MTTLSASEIIDLLGGTSDVAKLCEIKPPSVSEWRINGIPHARMQFLKAIRPDVFTTSAISTEAEVATCKEYKAI